jgi:hypothetical protein
MKLLLLSGKQGAGKTSIQKAMTEAWFRKYNRGAHFVNFADPIYEMHDEVLKVLHKYWPDRDLVKDGPLLQLLGTEWGRKIDENIWVKCLQKKVERMIEADPKSDGLIIVGDCRFENEFDAFPNALRVRLEAPEEVRQPRCSMWRWNTNHPSEIGLDNYSDNGKFDMYLKTGGEGSLSVGGCVALIVCQLDKQSYMERRK